MDTMTDDIRPGAMGEHPPTLIVHPELPCPDCGDSGLIAGDSYVDYCHCPAGHLRGRSSLADLQRYDTWED